VYHHLPVFFFSNGGGKTIPSGRCSHIAGSFYAKATNRFFFCFRGGRPLHNVHSLIFRNLLDLLAPCFTNSSPKAFLSNPSDFLPILRHSCRLVPGSFIHILHSRPFQHFFSYVHPFRVPLATLSLVWFFLTTCTLRHAAPTRRVIFLPAAANFFRDPQFLRVLSSG
jgi:hypothetical protein